MLAKNLLVTGSNGLIGSEMVKHFHDLGWDIHGVDNNMRADFFGPHGAPDGTNDAFREHSLFGASKLAGDILVQEYGRYVGLPTCRLRGGCLTGPAHSVVELHGFLSYLVKINVSNDVYSVYGYKGKQVRDNIHSFDVARFAEEFIASPRVAEVYNCGGGRETSCSILEAFSHAEVLTGETMDWQYVERAREGNHIYYVSDLTKMKRHYPSWDITKNLGDLFKELVEAWLVRE